MLKGMITQTSTEGSMVKYLNYIFAPTSVSHEKQIYQIWHKLNVNVWYYYNKMFTSYAYLE